jgi:hypothetical protein
MSKLVNLRGLYGAAVGLVLALASCGEDARDRDPRDDLDTAFVLGTRVWDDQTTTSYFHVVPSLDEGARVDESQALEVAGAAKLYAAFDLGWFAVGDGEAPTIKRFTLDAVGRLEEKQSIRLQGYGVKSLWDTLYFVSETKAYYPDRDGTQLIVWDPTSMAITGSIPLPQTAREGFLANYGYAAIERGDKLLITVGWFDWVTNDTVLGETGLLVLDTTTDEVVRFDVDTRCGGVTQPVDDAQGNTLLVSSALAGVAHRLGRLATPPCALRIPAGQDRIDTEYVLELGSLTKGALAGEPIPAGDGSVFLRSFDEKLATVTMPMATWELTGQAAWRWLRWDPAAGTASALASLPPSTSDVLWFRVDGKVLGTETKTDYSETTLIDLTAEGGPKRMMTVPGFLHGVARVR